MRLAWAMFAALVLGRMAAADALLSVSATAGSESCQQAAAASASCSVSSSIYVPGGQFYSPASASGNVSFGATVFPETLLLGPQGVQSLDYFLNANWSMGQGIALNDEASVELSASIELPANSGDWIFYGASYDATDDEGGEIGPIQVVTSAGTTWISGSGTSAFTIAHTPGTPLSLSINLSDYVAEAQSSNNLQFELRMLDPISTPEPASWALILAASVSLLALRSLIVHFS
jgi:hypothetical protein